MDERDCARIARYFAGDLPPEEEPDIGPRPDGELADGPVMDGLREIWEASAALPVRHRGNARRVWARVHAAMNEAPEGDAEGSRGAPAIDPMAERRSAGLPSRVGRDSHRKLRLPWQGRRGLLTILAVAAGLAAVALFGTRFGSLSIGDTDRVVVQELVTEKGQRARIRLSDGTDLLLGPASRIQMLSGFGAASREVRLTGEAYFDVSPDASRPFVVHVPGVVTRVLGTEFGIRAYPDEPRVQVVVAEGSVSVRSTGTRAGEEAVLQSGQLAELAPGDVEVIPHPADLDVHLAWRDGRLTFENTPLDQVVKDIERWYGVPVRLGDASLHSLRLTASFRDQPVEVILGAVAASLNLEWKRVGQTYMLVGRRSAHVATS